MICWSFSWQGKTLRQEGRSLTMSTEGDDSQKRSKDHLTLRTIINSSNDLNWIWLNSLLKKKKKRKTKNKRKMVDWLEEDDDWSIEERRRNVDNDKRNREDVWWCQWRNYFEQWTIMVRNCWYSLSSRYAVARLHAKRLYRTNTREIIINHCL